MPWQSREGARRLIGLAPRSSEQEQMEQAIRAELWKVLDTSDLESITSKEVGRGPGQGGAGPGQGGGTLHLGAKSLPLCGAFPPSFPPLRVNPGCLASAPWSRWDGCCPQKPWREG